MVGAKQPHGYSASETMNGKTSLAVSEYSHWRLATGHCLDLCGQHDIHLGWSQYSALSIHSQKHLGQFQASVLNERSHY